MHALKQPNLKYVHQKRVYLSLLKVISSLAIIRRVRMGWSGESGLPKLKGYTCMEILVSVLLYITNILEKADVHL